MMMTSFSNSPQRDIKQYISIYHVTVRTNSRRREEVHCSVSRPPPTVLPVNLQMGGCCSEATFHSVSFSKPNPVWFGKDTPKKCVGFSKPIPVWFGKKKWNFARRRFQTKFRLVWKILMTIVNVLKIPNQIQFGLEKSLTEYSVEHCSVG